MNFIPALRYLPGDLFKAKEFSSLVDAMLAFVDKQVADHHEALGEAEEEKKEVDNTDYIYSYLRQMRKQQALGNVESTLDVENLQKNLGGLFAAGTETTSSALRWALLFFLHLPHVQDRCFQEICEVVGPHRPPSMQDRPRLTYLEAFIREVLRKSDILPLALMHATARDVTCRGYVIPKDTTVIVNLSSTVSDPEIWGDPENFRPERFIGPDGKLIKNDVSIPVGIGRRRRVCVGESLARMELFLYLATLIQHFRFLPAEEGRLPSLEGICGLSHYPQP